MQDKLERLEGLLRSRNAEDFLDSLVNQFNGHFGAWLIRQQMAQECEGCPECSDGFDDVIN